jgi:phage/conjugal plasmid C-4 type zinc finger TraR family protein
MDQFDQAQELDARFRQHALERQKRISAVSAGESRNNCIDCGDPIPELRRKILPGCIRCIECATLFEADRRR